MKRKYKTCLTIIGASNMSKDEINQIGRWLQKAFISLKKEHKNYSKIFRTKLMK